MTCEKYLLNEMKELFTRFEIVHYQLCYISANDAKERQDWINKLRSVAEFHTSSIAEVFKSKCHTAQTKSILVTLSLPLPLYQRVSLLPK